MLPPSLNCRSAEPADRFRSSPFYVNRSLQPWAATPMPRRAGVSAFGIGGTNVHVVVEEAPPRPAAPAGHDAAPICSCCRRGRARRCRRPLRVWPSISRPSRPPSGRCGLHAAGRARSALRLSPCARLSRSRRRGERAHLARRQAGRDRCGGEQGVTGRVHVLGSGCAVREHGRAASIRPSRRSAASSTSAAERLRAPLGLDLR